MSDWDVTSESVVDEAWVAYCEAGLEYEDVSFEVFFEDFEADKLNDPFLLGRE